MPEPSPSCESAASLPSGGPPASLRGCDQMKAVVLGEMNLPIDRTFPLAEAAAHMGANAHFAKFVLEV